MSLLLQQPQPPLHLSPAAVEPSRVMRKDYVSMVLLIVGFGVVLFGAANVFSRAVAYVGGQPGALMLGPAAAVNGMGQ